MVKFDWFALTYQKTGLCKSQLKTTVAIAVAAVWYTQSGTYGISQYPSPSKYP